MCEEILHRHVHVNSDPMPDSIEIGTPGKDGAIKVYGNVDDAERFALRLETAFSLRQMAIEMARGARQVRRIEVLAPGITVKIENAKGEQEVLQG
ncbi:MAG: hypothetical protein QMD46_12400 [Methanomicrobiales archaeon]|nr:hypothetical protein [Methanomicrobiales archaeon]